MAEEEKNGAEEKEEEKKHKKSFLQNRLVLIAIILVAQAAIAFMLGSMISSKTTGVQVESVENEEWGERGSIVVLENIIVNLNEGDKLYYLKLTIGLEVANSAMQNEVEKREPHLRDVVISLVSGKKVSELDNLEERNALKAELHKELSQSLESGDLIQVYFSDFVIQ